MDNFYTVTVYNKGAEVIGMYKTLLGAQAFRKGMDLYFERHDGQAVTCDDFRAAMADASGRDLTQFERWYLQAGTPTVTVASAYDEASRTFRLTLGQSTKPTPGQPTKLPFHIPVRVGLLGADGSTLVERTVRIVQLDPPSVTTPPSRPPLHSNTPPNRRIRASPTPPPALYPSPRQLELTEEEQTFTFEGVDERPLPSVLRGFSAPVRLVTDVSSDELAFLAANDDDPFNRCAHTGAPPSRVPMPQTPRPPAVVSQLGRLAAAVHGRAA